MESTVDDRPDSVLSASDADTRCVSRRPALTLSIHPLSNRALAWRWVSLDVHRVKQLVVVFYERAGFSLACRWAQQCWRLQTTQSLILRIPNLLNRASDQLGAAEKALIQTRRQLVVDTGTAAAEARSGLADGRSRTERVRRIACTTYLDQ